MGEVPPHHTPAADAPTPAADAPTPRAPTQDLTGERLAPGLATSSTDDHLSAGETLASGQFRTSKDGTHRLVMQTDGNLVLRRVVDNAAVWSSGTAANPGARAVMQTDGNFVVYRTNNTPAWFSGTQGTGAVSVVVANDGRVLVMLAVQSNYRRSAWSSTAGLTGNTTSTLGPDSFMLAGSFLQSPDGTHRLEMRADGNLVLRRVADNATRWSSNTSVPGSYAAFQANGELMVWTPSAAGPQQTVFRSRSSGLGATRAVLANDGTLAIDLPSGFGSRPAWTTTRGLTGNAIFALGTGSRLDAGSFLQSPDGTHRLEMRADGNLVLRRVADNATRWSSNTAGATGSYAQLRADGSLAVFTATGTLRFSTPAASTGAYRAIVRNDGTLQLQLPATHESRPTWTSTTGATNNTLSSLGAGQGMSGGGQINSPDGRFKLVMQTDGNLVLYDDATARWSTASSNNPGAYMYLQTAGSIVVWSPASAGPQRQLFTSDPGGLGAKTLSLGNDGVLRTLLADGRSAWVHTTGLTGNSASVLTAPATLSSGAQLSSPSGAVTLTMQTDGNLVLRSSTTGALLWNAGTYNNPRARAVMQTDGNLVVYRADNTPAWHSATSGAAARLVVRDDGQMRVQSPGSGVLFSTGEPLRTDPPAGPFTQGVSIRRAASHAPATLAALVDTKPATANNFTDAPLAPNAEFVDAAGGVRIRHDGFDAAGNAKVVVTTQNTPAPPAPAVTRVELSANTVTVFVAYRDDPTLVARFELGRATSSAATAPLQVVASSPASTPRLSELNRTQGVFYYRVRSVGPTGVAGPWSDATSAVRTDWTPPSAPPNLKASSQNGQIRLTWDPSTDTGPSGMWIYRVWRNGVFVADLPATAREATVASGGAKATYEVAALDIATNSSPRSSVVK